VYEDVRAAEDIQRYPPPGKLVDVGGYRLHIDCMGQGSPTIVIDAGAGNWSVAWTGIQEQLAGETRVCTFDRAGLGWSDPGIKPRTSAVMADELYALLHNAALAPPFLMVGHSLGGYNVRVFTDRHSEVAGLVLIDSAHESQWRDLPIEVSAFKDAGLHQLYVARAMARVGLLHLLNAMPIATPIFIRAIVDVMNLAMVPPNSRDPNAKMLLDPKKLDDAGRELARLAGDIADVGYLDSTDAEWGGGVIMATRFMYYHELGHLLRATSPTVRYLSGFCLKNSS